MVTWCLLLPHLESSGIFHLVSCTSSADVDLDCEAVSSQHHDWTQRRPPLKRVVTTAVTTLWWHHSESHEPARVMNAIEGVGCSRLQVVLMDVCVGIDQTSSMTLLGIPSVLSLWHSNSTALTTTQQQSGGHNDLSVLQRSRCCAACIGSTAYS